MGAATQSRTSEVLERVSTKKYSFEDPGLAVIPPIISRRPDCVAEVDAKEDWQLIVRFFDGTAGTVAMKEMIFSPDAGVFAQLRDIAEFQRVGIGFGAVMWANGLDLAPDAMYDEIKRNGVWILR